MASGLLGQLPGAGNVRALTWKAASKIEMNDDCAAMLAACCSFWPATLAVGIAALMADIEEVICWS